LAGLTALPFLQPADQFSRGLEVDQGKRIYPNELFDRTAEQLPHAPIGKREGGIETDEAYALLGVFDNRTVARASDARSSSSKRSVSVT
jgi:hypothetical protein